MEPKLTKYLREHFEPGSPVRRQFEEFDGSLAGDPLCEDTYKHGDCLVHRYPNKVLLLVTQQCAANCSFCTRQRLCNIHYTDRQILEALEYIQSHEEVYDVLISGGDPFIVPERVKFCLSKLKSMSHVSVIRIGTRFPIVNPKKVADVLNLIGESWSNPVYINLHVNHPDELTPEVKDALESLRRSGYILGSQTVILKGINDSAEVLIRLFKNLVGLGVKPYYAYVTDTVAGTERFWVHPRDCMKLWESLRGQTGLCIPKLVWDSDIGKVYLPEYNIQDFKKQFWATGFEGLKGCYELDVGKYQRL